MRVSCVSFPLLCVITSAQQGPLRACGRSGGVSKHFAESGSGIWVPKSLGLDAQERGELDKKALPSPQVCHPTKYTTFSPVWHITSCYTIHTSVVPEIGLCHANCHSLSVCRSGVLNTITAA